MFERTNSLLPRLPTAVPSVLTFAAAAHAATLGRNDWANDLLSTLDDHELREHFDAVADEWRRRDETATGHWSDGALEDADRELDRMPDGPTELAIFRRDEWHCRWCGTPVIRRRATKAMSKAVPGAFPDGVTNAARHGLVLACSASLDHVLAHSKGGLNTEDNLVTACWPCQFARGNDSIERIGLFDPAERLDAPVVRGWDGCDWYG